MPSLRRQDFRPSRPKRHPQWPPRLRRCRSMRSLPPRPSRHPRPRPYLPFRQSRLGLGSLRSRRSRQRPAPQERARSRPASSPMRSTFHPCFRLALASRRCARRGVSLRCLNDRHYAMRTVRPSGLVHACQTPTGSRDRAARSMSCFNLRAPFARNSSYVGAFWGSSGTRTHVP